MTFVLAALVLLGTLLVGSETARADASGDPSEDVHQEYLTPAYVLVPGSPGLGEVRLIDDLTGENVPLTGSGVERDGNATRVHLPQLPPGTFTVVHPGGERRITVLAFDGSLGPIGDDDLGRPWALYVVAGALLLLTLAARRRRLLLLVGIGGAAALLGFASFDGKDRGDLLQEWSACDGANAGAKDQLSCKVSALTLRLERGEYDTVRDAIGRSTDPACHEITHRSSYHIWRTTRDRARAEKMLIPGCDDGLIHGISESMATFASDEEFPLLLDGFCSAATETFARTACLHGGGHAAVWRTNGDLYASFDLCDRFPVDAVLEYDVREECKGSAVMEWSERWSRERQQGGSTLRPRLDEPMTICLEGPASHLFRLGCYLGTNFRTGDAADAARWCNEREELRVPCFEAIGENLPYFETPMTTIPLTADKALNHLASCTLAEEAATRAGCVRSAVRVYSVMKLSHTLGEDLCEAIPATDLEACRLGVEDAEKRLAARGLALG